MSNERKELKYSGLKDTSKIEDELKEEAEEFEIKEKAGWFLLQTYKKASLWKNCADTKDFYTRVISENGIEDMKKEFIEVIEKLSKICDRLEAKLKEM